MKRHCDIIAFISNAATTVEANHNRRREKDYPRPTQDGSGVYTTVSC